MAERGKGADALTATVLNDFSASTDFIEANSPAVGRPLVVSMFSTSPPTNTGGFFNLDNVRLDASVPEPGALALLGLAGAALLGRRRAAGR